MPQETLEELDARLWAEAEARARPAPVNARALDRLPFQAALATMTRPAAPANRFADLPDARSLSYDEAKRELAKRGVFPRSSLGR